MDDKIREQLGNCLKVDKLIKIGVCGVDSGQIMICDPCYIDSEWGGYDYSEDGSPVKPSIYMDKETQKTYAYAGFLPEKCKVDVPFAHWEVSLEDYGGMTPNQVRDSGKWVEAQLPPGFNHEGDFNYRGVCHTASQRPINGQLNYKLGHPGAGVAMNTQMGDGCYPVFAELDPNGCIARVVIDFRCYDYENEMTPEQYTESTGHKLSDELKEAEG